MFTSWARGLSPDIELNLVHFPGRDQRVRETLYEDLSALIEPLVDAFLPRLDKPFVFFGHSMGALVSFEVARTLRRQFSLQPVHLFISARRAPQLYDSHSNIYQLPERQFLEQTEDLYGNLPAIIKADPEILQLFLTIMRADLTMMGKYQYNHEPPLECPISVYGGLQDKSVSEFELRAWQEHTSKPLNVSMFAGDHFYLHGSRTALLQSLIRNLSHY